MGNKPLINCLELYIDHRGLTPGKLNTKWTRNGYKVLSANNVKNDGIINTEEIRFIDEHTYKRWMNVEIQRNDILLTSEAPAGEIYLWDSDEKIATGQRLYALRTNREVDPKYLAYYLKSSIGKHEIKRHCSGSTVFGISARTFDLINIVLPETIKDQQKIGEILFLIDSKIRNKNRINAELDLIVNLLYHYWFVQFDFPNPEGKPYKSSGGKMFWNEDLKKEIPEGWELKTISSLIESSKNGDWGKAEPIQDATVKVNCIRGTDISSLQSNTMITVPVRYIKENNREYILADGDLIIEISGGSPIQSTGRIIYVNSYTIDRFQNPIICSNFCKAIRVNDINYRYWLYKTWNRLYENNVFIKYESKTTGIKNLMYDIFTNHFVIATPPKPIVTKFEKIASFIFNMVQKNGVESQELLSLQEFLLPILMNGQVTIKS